MNTCRRTFFLGRWALCNLAFLAICCLLAGTALATSPYPLYGTRIVDGDSSDWNLDKDFYDYMFRSGDPEFPVESSLYLRYDCPTNTLYVLVLTVPDVYIRAYETRFHWVAINEHSNKVVDGDSGNDGTPPDFAWVGFVPTPEGGIATGWEASCTLMDGTYSLFVSARVIDSDKVETSANRGHTATGIPMILDCTVPVEQSTWGKIKCMYK